MSSPKSVAPQLPTTPRVVLLAPDCSDSVIAETVDGQVHSLAYSTYGHQSAQQDIATRLGFNGQLRESTIGWYLLGKGYRVYNPLLMRFHSPDSWSPFRGGGLNPYMYCVGDPINHIDPSGRFVEAVALLFKENVSFGGSMAGLRARNASSRAHALAREQAIYALRAAGGARTEHARQSTTEGLTVIGGYVLGAPGPRDGPPALEYVAQSQKRFPGYEGASAYRPAPQVNHSNGVVSRASGPSPSAGGGHGITMPLWNANTVARGARDFNAFPVGVGSPPEPLPPVRVGNTSGSSVNTRQNAVPVFAETHAPTGRQTVAVAAIIREPSRGPSPASASSSSQSTSRDSTPTREPTPPINWQPLNR